jgi:large subunit ribosomal protein L7/L12
MDIVPIITKKVIYKIGVLKMASQLDSLVEQLGKLTVIEAGELSKKLEKVWNLDLSALTSAPAPVNVVDEETSLVKVILTGFAPGKKIPIIKAIRPILELGLIEAKNFAEDLPKAVKEDLDKADAEKLKQILEEAGGTVELK